MTEVKPIPELTAGMKVFQLEILEIIQGHYPKGMKKVSGAHKNKTVRCLCDCGIESIKYYDSIRWHKTKSCGCLSKKTGLTHGMHKSPEYQSWDGMKRRCYNKNGKDYERYGARGIIVCDKWLTFEGFFDDMGPKSKQGYTLDRIDSNGNYEKSNCRWASSVTQSRNKRTNKLTIEKAREIRRLSFTITNKELRKMFGVSHSVISNVISCKSWKEL